MSKCKNFKSLKDCLDCNKLKSISKDQKDDKGFIYDLIICGRNRNQKIYKDKVISEKNFVKLIVDGKPQPKQRPCPDYKRRRMFTPKETLNYEKKVKYLFIQSKQKKFDKIALTVELKIYLDIPVSFSLDDRQKALKNLIYPTKKPDVDNVAKSVLDGMNGCVYDDDAYVQRLVVDKFYSDYPRVEIKVFASK